VVVLFGFCVLVAFSRLVEEDPTVVRIVVFVVVVATVVVAAVATVVVAAVAAIVVVLSSRNVSSSEINESVLGRVNETGNAIVVGESVGVVVVVAIVVSSFLQTQFLSEAHSDSVETSQTAPRAQPSIRHKKKPIIPLFIDWTVLSGESRYFQFINEESRKYDEN
jgi:hypothetical protein